MKGKKNNFENFILILISLSRHLLMEDISKQDKGREMNNLLNNFNFGLNFSFFFILATFLSLVIAISFQLISMKNRKSIFKAEIKRLMKKILFDYSQVNRSISKLTLFLLFYYLHLWFIKLTISNSIKTNKGKIHSFLKLIK